MYTETASRALLTLPGEIQNEIIHNLEPLEVALLRATCNHFRSIISPLNIHDLLDAESSTAGMDGICTPAVFVFGFDTPPVLRTQ